MTQKLSDNIQQDLEKACILHKRATSDYEKCVEFNKLMSGLLARLEDEGHYRLADRVMTILLDCVPKEPQNPKTPFIRENIRLFTTSPFLERDPS